MSARDSTANLVVLEYNGHQTVVLRPQSYQALEQSVIRYFPSVSLDHNHFTFESNDLPISNGNWVRISEDAWDIAIPLVHMIRVTSSICTQPVVDGYHIIIKARVQEVSSITRDQQRLVHLMERMDEDKTLDDYGIVSGTTVDLMLELKGGKHPPTTTRVSAKLSLVPGWEFSAIYPVVPAKTSECGQELEWVVDASPDGLLKEVGSTGLEVSYLFWEAETTTDGLLSPPLSPQLGGGSPTEVFVPNRATLSSSDSVVLTVDKVPRYLDASLKSLGLHVEARTSFITYWLPSILKHTHIALRFLPQHVYERAAPLDIHPTPDVILHVFMLFRGLDEAQYTAWLNGGVSAARDVDWRAVVGVDGAKMEDTGLFRVLSH